MGAQPEDEELLACAGPEGGPSATADAPPQSSGCPDATAAGEGCRSAWARPRRSRLAILAAVLLSAALLAFAASIATGGPAQRPATATRGAEARVELIGKVAHKEKPKHDKDHKCAKKWGDCTKSECCREKGYHCFAKNKFYASCKPKCIPGPDKFDKNHTWSCKPLGCSENGEDCTRSGCCKSPGLMCYEKDKFFSTCREACYKGKDLTDPKAGEWTCKEQGPRTPGGCSWPGQNCRETHCCRGTSMQCWAKNSTYGGCKPSCVAGDADPTDSDWEPWSCEPLGKRIPGRADWVSKKCTGEGQECTMTKCCNNAFHQCYGRQGYGPPRGFCKKGCTPGEKPKPWALPYNCKELGARTPMSDWEASRVPATRKVSPWVEDRCAALSENCASSKCCKGVGLKCFAKDKKWAMCMPSCKKGRHPDDKNATWSCKPLGPRSFGLARVGWPSLFCFSVMRTTGYEPGIMSMQLRKRAGIFACDDFQVLANGNITIGHVPKGKPLGSIKSGPVQAMVIKKASTVKVGVSQDGTAANTLLFMHVWDMICRDGRFRYHDWTVKVDPDAVLLPWRLRTHMAPHTGATAESWGKLYVVNCDKFPFSANFPMMYGAVEIISMLALDAYGKGIASCARDLGWQKWGEDYFMTHCLDHIGVGRIGDFSSLGDALCLGANCGDTWTASFHPFKNLGAWEKCWDQATAKK